MHMRMRIGADLTKGALCTTVLKPLVQFGLNPHSHITGSQVYLDSILIVCDDVRNVLHNLNVEYYALVVKPTWKLL